MFSNVTSFKLNFERRLLEKYGRLVRDSNVHERYDILGEMVRDFESIDWRLSNNQIHEKTHKQLIYFSMEFLIGRLLVNNMMNLGVYDVAREGLESLGLDIHELETIESDAGLGNGGLGRLAACFLDSIASLSYPGHGNCIRYDYGFFRQKILNGQQIELPDQWLKNGNVWEVRRPQQAITVNFYGNVRNERLPDGNLKISLENGVSVSAVPYDVSIPGFKNRVVNNLRLWSAEPSSDFIPNPHMSFEEYLVSLKELCHGLYPDDSTEHGKLLRLRQQYFLVSAGLQSAIRSHFKTHQTLKNFAEFYVFQLNDTHPILAIPEMMRIMLDEYMMSWDEAWYQVSHAIAYTNHTIMAEALEKWPTKFVANLIPRCFNIIEEIDRRFNAELYHKGINEQASHNMRIIKDGQIHMTNLAIYTAFSINGVADVHTEILKTMTFRDFYQYFPEKFNNKTNGVTHRRWLMYANPSLARLINEKIGSNWQVRADDLTLLLEHQNDESVLKALHRIKIENKERLQKYVLEHYGIELDTHSIFDIQIKRLHAYKRQLLNIFNIIHLYQRLKEDPGFNLHPHTFIFGAKAAPSYQYAKRIIELIIAVAKVVNNDPSIKNKLKIVFMENYGVSLAEIIIPAADISEQISTAGKEASGTSNMKFMMNGAITLGTLDGANIEIHERVGDENSIIFGMNVAEVEALRNSHTYHPFEYYSNDSRIKKIMDSLIDGTWHEDTNRFRMIFDEIMYHNDEYFVLKDFDSYARAHDLANQLYQDPLNWQKMCLINIAQSGQFSSDRTIMQYVQDIWHLKKVEVK